MKAGQVIDRYELVCPIGDGGMASVWAARERSGASAGRLVALKMIHSRFAEDAAFRAMFLDEATIALSIDHPNVAKVYEHVATPDRLYLAMEYVDGDSLYALCSQYRTAPLAVALHVAAEACAGLHAAHSLTGPDGRSRNVVHRDVSPQNILVGVNGETRIIDFGIAHARDRAGQATALGVIKGKIRYMAPEQARKSELGPWTDVFGIGATLYRLVGGRPPYAADTDVATMQALLAGAPPLVPLPADVPTDVAQVVQQAIAADPRDRFQSTAALRNALLGLLRDLGEKPDVTAFVDARMSEQTRARRALLASAPAVPELDAPAVKRTPRGTEVMTPLGMTIEPAAAASASGIKTTALMQSRPGAEAESQRRDAPSDKPPGFMDVQAIMAQARVPELPVPPSSRKSGSKGDPARPKTPQKIELQFEPRNRAKGPPVGSGLTRIAILVITAVLLIVVVFVAVPLIVKSRAIATAREAGLDMTVERTGVGFGTATFRGVKMKLIHVPGVTIDIDELFVRGFSVKELRVVGAVVVLDGAPADFETGLGMFVAENRARFAGTAEVSRKLTVASSKVLWRGPGGAGLEASDVGADVESRGNGNEDAKATAMRVFYKTGKTTLGPWGVSYETSAQGTRSRLALDPALPDGPSVLYVSTATGPAKITVKAARSPLANFGFKPAELGLPADGSTEIETYLEGELGPDGKVSLVGPTAIWGLRPRDVKKPLDVKIEGAIRGVVGQPLEIDRMLLTFGPFTAVVTGTVTADKGNLRVDALAKANAIPCDKLARMEARTMGSFVQMLQAFGESTGALKVRGEVNASCAVKYDTADPEATSVTWLARETCGLSIFGL